MADLNSDTPSAAGDSASQSSAPTNAVMPTRAVGWLAVGLTVAGIASLIAVMVMAAAANDPSAVDNRIMIASIVLLVGAGLISLLSVSLWRQRSVLNILAVVVCAGALGLLLMLGLGGFFNGVL
ncbi:MAG: hypothetical protein ACYC2X_10695 [Coriobacteriia bacterium]